MGHIMAEHKAYTYTDSNSPDELQKLLDDTMISGEEIFENCGFTVVTVGGKPEIIGKNNGADNPDAQHTVRFDVVTEKYGATGFYCLNPCHYYADKTWVDVLPDFNNYEDILSTDDISQWVDPNEEA